MQSAGWDCVQWSSDTGSYREDTLRAVLDTVLGDLVKTAFVGKVSLGMLLFPAISTHFCYAQLKLPKQICEEDNGHAMSADAQWVVLRAQRQLGARVVLRQWPRGNWNLNSFPILKLELIINRWISMGEGSKQHHFWGDPRPNNSDHHGWQRIASCSLAFLWRRKAWA